MCIPSVGRTDLSEVPLTGSLSKIRKIPTGISSLLTEDIFYTFYAVF